MNGKVVCRGEPGIFQIRPPGMKMNLPWLKTLIYMCFFLFFSPFVRAQQEIITVLSYNALHGFNGDSVVQDQYANWAKSVGADIILYQEMNGFSQKHLRDLASKYGHDHSVILNQESGHDVTHPIAVTSKFPILEAEMYLDSMWHGYVYAKIGGIHCFVTHLAPFTLEDRRRDLIRIIAHAAKIPAMERILIAGDFNALSDVDSMMYDSSLLASMKRIEGRLEPKSGTPIVKYRTIYRNNLNDGKIDYSVMRLLQDAAFVDSYYIVNSKFKNSVPTSGHAKANSKPRRIDYVWVNGILAEEVDHADILQDEQTNVMSDHYPVMVKFKLR